MTETGGRFSNNSEIFQQLATLPVCNGEYVQANTFVIGGKYGGTVLRAGGLIIGYNSNAKVLRVLDDGSSLPTDFVVDNGDAGCVDSSFVEIFKYESPSFFGWFLVVCLPLFVCIEFFVNKNKTERITQQSHSCGNESALRCNYGLCNRWSARLFL